MSFYIQSKNVKGTVRATSVKALKDILTPGMWYVLAEDGKEYIVEVAEC